MPKKSAVTADPSGRSSWLYNHTRQQHTARYDGDSKPHSSRHHTHVTDVHGLGCGSGLRGLDLVEQIAQNTKLQKLRWMEIYKRLWERKAKVDIADTILIAGGTPQFWFFTSSATGEIQRKHDHKLNAIAIKKHFVKTSLLDAKWTARQQIALLVHEDRDASMRYAVLSDLEFNAILCQPSSPLWMSSFLLQPFMPPSQQHPAHPGTFVAKYNAASSSSSSPCIRVLHTETYFHGMSSSGSATKKTTPVDSAANDGDVDDTQTNHAAQRRRAPSTTPSTSPMTDQSSRRPRSATTNSVNHSVEEIVKREMAKVVHEVELAFHDKLRWLHCEFLITSTHRLVLLRVSHVVFVSDLKQKREKGSSATAHAHDQTTNTNKLQRPSSTTYPGSSLRKCAGGSFCHCKIFASAAALNVPLPSAHEFQRITRKVLRCMVDIWLAGKSSKSMSLSEKESEYLERFGAHAEAQLVVSPLVLRAQAQDAFTKLLQRRIFMLQSTLWNPKSDAFQVKPLEYNESKLLPQQYEMIQVCRACYLIYHTIDGERFQASRSTSKAAARLYNAKVLSATSFDESGALVSEASSSPPRKARAWEQTRQ
uniref:Uncharacterized protein n=1 Tax=Globisporangium ultimum (strain ATCC 200006 / CBS 805.95 / DAOM BR144) TaxID=431595 RepID=K3W9V7_GLOUD